MSYILDALRKADAERERGSVPNIHAQPLAAGLPLDPASRIGGFGGLDDGTRRWLIGGGAAAALAVVAALALPRLTAPEAPAVAVPAVAVDRGFAPAAAPLDPPVATEQPFGGAPATSITDPPASSRRAAAPPAVVPTYRPVPAAPTRSPAVAATPRLATAAPEPAPASGVAGGRTAAALAGTPPSTATAAAEPASPTVADNRIYQTRELPDDIRRELPVLTVGGATYSENAASRMLIINGQVFHENDRLAPELVLERIQLRSAVLRYKGLRYSIAY